MRTHDFSEHMDSVNIMAKPDEEMYDTDGQVQETRFHQDANNKSELLGGGAILASL